MGKKTDSKKVEVNKNPTSADDVWTKEEVTLLTKAILKFPSGMAQRWDKIVGFMGGKKSVPQVTAMVTDLKCKNLKGPDALRQHIENYIENLQGDKKDTVLKEQNGAQENEPKQVELKKTDSKQKESKIAEPKKVELKQVE